MYVCVPQVMHLLGKNREVELGQDFPLCVTCRHKHTVTILSHYSAYGALGRELSLKPKHTRAKIQTRIQSCTNTHKHTFTPIRYCYTCEVFL